MGLLLFGFHDQHDCYAKFAYCNYGDTFGKVQENYLIADTHELLEMIIEIETIMIKNRDFSDPCYFQMCIEGDIDEMKDEDYRINSLKKNIKALQTENAKTNAEIKILQKEMREGFEKLSLAISARGNENSSLSP